MAILQKEKKSGSFAPLLSSPIKPRGGQNLTGLPFNADLVSRRMSAVK